MTFPPKCPLSSAPEQPVAVICCSSGTPLAARSTRVPSVTCREMVGNRSRVCEALHTSLQHAGAVRTR